ncbi:2,5-diamino-6-(ribosylamino)-4(3H)-pyrimidinone 5'-phosphate reductase [Gonapodya sp. JEL0774]|nr:2,5-diamino-6-(ribosylamino)-4(3H)-pyrimidinone 5'-phosphate reductase [Gonapodya sp. JEL0774]
MTVAEDAIALLGHRISLESDQAIPLDSQLPNPKARSDSSLMPFVTVTYAQSLDGFIALPDRRSLAISCRESLIMTHVLRTLHDAILVGVGTVLGDDPRLNARIDILGDDGCEALNRFRGVSGKSDIVNQPRPVVVDSTLLKFPVETSRLMGHPRGKPIILTTKRCSEERRKMLEEQGVCIIVCGDQTVEDSVENAEEATPRVDLQDGFRKLRSQFGIRTIMVEGGAGIIGSLLSAAGVNADPIPSLVVVTIAPTFVGDGVKALEIARPHSKGQLSHVVHLDDVEYKQFGQDIVMVASVRKSV